ncbi:ribonuclease HI [Shewanella sp. Scap07]|uniref:ribonuclease H1 domain-containing protein n=1 Tax=Shewanella sp. Scap07 TaxID=2589987 RepID=UPI0015BB2879|nr:ribonuclease H family protein [Shewanella sp. Scap07]QLE85846.1 ribonuclease HI [Shewanella sp. Scap07]
MATKYYVIWAGRQTGIFTDWPTAKAQVDGFAGARYKSFKSREEAEAAFKHRPATQKATSTKAASKTDTQAKLLAAKPNSDIDIYTDGGCEPNPGEAGSGIAVYKTGQLDQLWYGLYHPDGTNNSAELNALYQALLLAKKYIALDLQVHIHSDSQYSLNCITNWAYSWKAKGWKRKTAGDIKNLTIIQQAHALYDEIKEQVTISHVAAHIGIEGNELADRMSIYAIDVKDSAFTRYPDPIDVDAILALRTG